MISSGERLLALIEHVRADVAFLDIDQHFARLCARHEQQGEVQEAVFVVALAVSRALREGHPCVFLPDLYENGWFEGFRHLTPGFEIPALDRWGSILTQARSVSITRAYVHGAQETPPISPPPISTPLVFDEAGRVYVTRYFIHEWRLALCLKRLRSSSSTRARRSDVAWSWLEERLDRYFPSRAGEGRDLQREAARSAVIERLMIVSGGPGTGKTSTVVKILALLVEDAYLRHEPAPRISLLAPTGKAAARLNESIVSALSDLGLPEEISRVIRPDATTIHRALGVRPDSNTRFVRDGTNPLMADVVLVDEGSMVDLALMRNLCEALGQKARLLILGDRNQLASVEAGSVFSDLCDAFSESERSDSGSAMIELTRSYRFEAASEIAKMSAAVCAGDWKTILELRARSRGDVVFREAIDDSAAFKGLLDLAFARWKAAFLAATPEAALQEFSKFRILCAHREGPFGVHRLNQAIWQRLSERGGLRSTFGVSRGQLIIILENDAALGLNNGDVAVIWPDGSGHLNACFPGDREVRRVAVAQLPRHELCFALTIHKSQGSEYDEVALVLPPPGSPILTRELVYTGLTRAKRCVHVYAEEKTLEEAVQRCVRRRSGLSSLLRRLA